MKHKVVSPLTWWEHMCCEKEELQDPSAGNVHHTLLVARHTRDDLAAGGRVRGRGSTSRLL